MALELDQHARFIQTIKVLAVFTLVAATLAALTQWRIAQLAETVGLVGLLVSIGYKLSRQLEASRSQLEDEIAYSREYLAISARLEADYPLPQMRNWALTPTRLEFVLKRFRTSQATKVLEFGSGTSTIVLGLEFKRRGAGKVVSIEAEPDWIEKVREMISLHGLENHVELYHCPLVDTAVNGKTQRFYDVSVFREAATGADFVLVDGPPQSTAALARYSALPVCKPFLASAATIILDDANRPAEREIWIRWTAEFGITDEQRLTSCNGMVTGRLG